MAGALQRTFAIASVGQNNTSIVTFNGPTVLLENFDCLLQTAFHIGALTNANAACNQTFMRFGMTKYFDHVGIHTVNEKGLGFRC